MTRFELKYAATLRPLLSALGIGPRWSGVDVGDGELRVRMGWAFRTRISLEAVVHAEPATWWWLGGWGVHGWDGKWLVNGSSHGIVRIDLARDGRARVCGVPVRLRTLWVSLADPEAALGALRQPRADAV